MYFSTVIPRNVRLAEPQAMGCHIYSYDQLNGRCKAYNKFALEVLDKRKEGERKKNG